MQLYSMRFVGHLSGILPIIVTLLLIAQNSQSGGQDGGGGNVCFIDEIPRALDIVGLKTIFEAERSLPQRTQIQKSILIQKLGRSQEIIHLEIYFADAM